MWASLIPIQHSENTRFFKDNNVSSVLLLCVSCVSSVLCVSCVSSALAHVQTGDFIANVVSEFLHYGVQAGQSRAVLLQLCRLLPYGRFFI